MKSANDIDENRAEHSLHSDVSPVSQLRFGFVVKAIVNGRRHEASPEICFRMAPYFACRRDEPTGIVGRT